MDTKTQSTQSISDDQELAEVLAGVSGISDDNLEFEETPVPTTYSQPAQPVVETTLPEPLTEPVTAPGTIADEEVPDISIPDQDPVVAQPAANEESIIGYNPPAETNDEPAETPIAAEEPTLDYDTSPSNATDNPVASDYEMPAEPVEAPVVGYNPPAESATPNTASGELDDIKQDALIELRPLVDKLSLTPEEKFDIYLLLLRSTDDKSLIAPAHAAAQAIPDEGRRAQALLDIIKEIDYLSNQQPLA